MSDAPIVVAAASFASIFSIQISNFIRANLRAGESMVKCPTTGRPEMEGETLRKVLAESRPSALIGICIRPDAAVVAAYKAAGVPVVLMDEEVTGATTVTADNFLGGYLAGDHLAKRGRKKIAAVVGRTGLAGDYNALQRLKGFEKALAARGLSLVPGGTVEVVNYSYQDGMQAMANLLDAGLEIDAVFSAAGDVCATGILKTAADRRLRVPQDLAVVGYDDLDVAANSIPPLTTVRQPIEQMAAAAYQAAVIEKTKTLARPQKVYFKPSLSLRESS